MFSNVNRYPPKNGSVYNVGDNTVLDFQFPPSAYIDVENSYLSVIAKLETADGVVHRASLGWKDNQYLTNGALLKQCRVMAAGSVIEDVVNQNVVNCNLDSYEMDWEERISTNFKSLGNNSKNPMQLSDYETSSDYVEINEQPKYREKEIKIPLKSISRFCRGMGVLDTNKLQGLTMRTQWDMSRIEIINNDPLQGHSFYDFPCANMVADGKTVISTQQFANLESLLSLGIKVGSKVFITFTIPNDPQKVTNILDDTAVAVTDVALVGNVVHVTVNSVNNVLATYRNVAIAGVPTDDGLRIKNPTGNASFILIPAIDNQHQSLNGTTQSILNMFRERYLDKSVLIQRNTTEGQNATPHTVNMVSMYTNSNGNYAKLDISPNIPNVALYEYTAFLYLSDNLDRIDSDNYTWDNATKTLTLLNGADLLYNTFWDGQTISLAGISDADMVVYLSTKIQGIATDGDDLVINTADSFGAATIADNSELVIRTIQNKVDYTITKPTLTVKTLMSGNALLKNYLSQPKKMIVPMASVELRTIPANTTSYSYQFESRPNTVLMYFCIVLGTDIYSLKNYITNFRVLLNQKQLTTLPVLPFSPRHYDMLISTFGKSQLVNLRSLAPVIQSENIDITTRPMTVQRDMQFLIPVIFDNAQQINQVVLQVNFSEAPTNATVYAISENYQMVDLSGTVAKLF